MRILFRLMVAPRGVFVNECQEKVVSGRVWREEGWYVWARKPLAVVGSRS